MAIWPQPPTPVQGIPRADPKRDRGHPPTVRLCSLADCSREGSLSDMLEPKLWHSVVDGDQSQRRWLPHVVGPRASRRWEVAPVELLTAPDAAGRNASTVAGEQLMPGLAEGAESLDAAITRRLMLGAPRQGHRAGLLASWLAWLVGQQLDEVMWWKVGERAGWSTESLLECLMYHLCKQEAGGPGGCSLLFQRLEGR